MPGFVYIGKPKGIPGNIMPGYDTSFAGFKKEDSTYFDAALIRLYFVHDCWIVDAIDHCPGPGDFVSESQSSLIGLSFVHGSNV